MHPALPLISTALAGRLETRPIFQGIDLIGKALFYVAATASILVFCYGWYRRVRKYRRGRPAGRGRLIRAALTGHPLAGVRQRTDTGSAGVVASNISVIRRDRRAGVAHFFIFWGFLTLFAGTVILTIDVDILRNVSRLVVGHEDSFFHGPFYLGYKLVLNTLGLAALIAVLYMVLRRAVRRPAKLNYARAQSPAEGYSRSKMVAGDWLFLGFFVALLITGFVLEAFRIVDERFPSFEVFSISGWLLGKAFAAMGLTARTAYTAHAITWYVHATLALAFVAYIPYSKAMHMIVDAVNVLAHDRGSSRRLTAPAESGHAGYQKVEDFTWKELMDLDACTKCGRCHEVCPARAGGAPLSPRDFILDLRQWVDTRSDGVTLLDRETRNLPTGPLSGNGATRIAGEVIPVATLWSCTTCMACVEACPVGIEHVPAIVSMRRGLVDSGEMDPTLQTALKNLAQQGNSFGKSARMRARWTRGLDFKIPDARTEKVHYLWYVGDYASFDDRLQANSRLLATLLHRAGVSFGLLYEDEWNAGNDVRRVGEEGLYDMLAEHNVDALAGAQFDEIFTTDPHTLNTLRNEYPDRGARYTVWHYTELLAHLLDSGELPVRPLNRRVTYHDPCYLARYNGVTEAPRRILASLGCELVEMPRNRSNTFCCGAGGGRIWMDDSMLTERPSENRINEAAGLGVGEFIVSCPKDMTMYSDAAKTTGHDATLTVSDIVRLVDEAAVLPSPPQPDELAVTS